MQWSLQIKITFIPQHYIKEERFNVVHIALKRNHILMLQVSAVNLLKPTGYVMHQLFNIQQLYALPTLYLCVLYLSENKQRLVPLTS
jgi:hypothetical protein